MQSLFAMHDLQILHHGSYLLDNDHGLLRVRFRQNHDEFFTAAVFFLECPRKPDNISRLFFPGQCENAFMKTG